MSTPENTVEPKPQKITIIKNGPYRVEGGIPLLHKTQVVSENGEPLTWKKSEPIETPDGVYMLCRCGMSSRFPFCDGTHRREGFDGTETASTDTTSERRTTIPGSSHIIVMKDETLCTGSGFCGMMGASFADFVMETDNTRIRSLVIAMVERCPSGALTYRIDPNETDIEPDLNPDIATTVEVLSDGPIRGPLFVTGSIEIERSDGQPIEARNRVTLCNCGHSHNKPLCDGSHRVNAKHVDR